MILDNALPFLCKTLVEILFVALTFQIRGKCGENGTEMGEIQEKRLPCLLPRDLI